MHLLNADLHCHSTVSDGWLDPADVVRRAQANGVELLALTDHDELSGLDVAARTAVDEARNAPANLRLVAAGTVGAGTYGETVAQRAEAALVMLRALVNRRTAEGWEIMDVLGEAGSGKDAATRLGITPSAVSQRAARAARAESLLGVDLATALLAEAMGVPR